MEGITIIDETDLLDAKALYEQGIQDRHAFTTLLTKYPEMRDTSLQSSIPKKDDYYEDLLKFAPK